MSLHVAFKQKENKFCLDTRLDWVRLGHRPEYPACLSLINVKLQLLHSAGKSEEKFSTNLL